MNSYQFPGLRRGGASSSRSPRRRGTAAQMPVSAADGEELLLIEGGAAEGCDAEADGAGGALSGPMMGQQMAMMGQQQQQLAMRQMAMMTSGNPAMAQQVMMQQQFMMRQFQMGAMQQLMLRQQQAFANAMRMSGATTSFQSNPAETQRQMGRQAYANAVAAMNRDANADEDEAAPSGPSSSVHHPNYRPADAELMPGITDRRFEGRLKLWFEDKGYGFIECDGTRKKYPDVDVFLHANQKRHFGKGDYISFNVFLNYKGRPQATELRKAKEPAEDAGA